MDRFPQKLIISGLQGHTASFSWKITFVSDQRSYELILCACSAREEEEWKRSLSQHIALEKQRPRGQCSVISALDSEASIISPDIRPIGSFFRMPGRSKRRQSIQRAATIDSDPRKRTRQIIIKNMHTPVDGADTHMTLNRSQTSPSASPITVLIPKRVERHRIEQGMAKVWTRDRLPYPSMASHRGEYFKNSASTVMRKLSKASTVTNSSRSSYRGSVSHTSIADSSPYSAQLGASRMAQYDGSTTPTPQRRKSFTPTLRPENSVTPTPQPRNSVSFGSKVLPSFAGEGLLVEHNGDGMRYRIKFEESPASSTPIANHRASGVSPVAATRTRDSLELERDHGKNRKPKTLLKALSTEGIRGWFH